MQVISFGFREQAIVVKFPVWQVGLWAPEGGGLCFQQPPFELRGLALERHCQESVKAMAFLQLVFEATPGCSACQTFITRLHVIVTLHPSAWAQGVRSV